MSELKCKDRIKGELMGRIEDLTILWNAYTGQNEQIDHDEYGLTSEELKICWDIEDQKKRARTEDGYVVGGDLDGAHIYEYGLSFDYVSAEDHKRGYFRYQLSWGGPSDEFRIYAEGTGYKWSVDRIDYMFMDWFDGAKRTLSGDNFKLIEDIFQSLFVDTGTVQIEFDKVYQE